MNASVFTGAWQPELKNTKDRWMAKAGERTACIITGSFRSDGTRSPLSPEEETGAALRAGADIVFRLPAIAVLSGAEVQAFATLTLADRLGIVSDLAIPVNKLTREMLEEIAMFLFKEPLPYQKAIRKRMAEGIKYPEARAASLEDYIPGAGDILRSPADSCAVELRLATLRRYSRVKLSLIHTTHGQGEDAPSEEDHSRDAALAKKISDFLKNHSDDELTKIIQSTPSFPWIAGETLWNCREEFLTCGSLTEMSLMLESGKVTAEQVRRGLIMMLLGIRLANVSIAGLDAFCPYIRVSGITEDEEASKEWIHALFSADTCVILPDGKPLGDHLPDESCAHLAAFDLASDQL